MTLHNIRFIIPFIGLITLTGLSSCIRNDIPYPYLESVIQEIAVYDMIGDPQIDTKNKTVEITVGEDATLSSLKVTKLTVSSDAEIIPDSAVCERFNQFPNFSFASADNLPANANTNIDFTNPVRFILRTYQDYIWTVTVKQEIERTVEVEHQVGNAQLDIQNHKAIIYIEEGQSLKNVHIKTLNLEGSKAEVLPDPSTVTDFTRSRTFRYFKEDEYIGAWTVDVQIATVLASAGETNAWATKAYVEGEMKSGATPVIEYKETTSSEWTAVASEQVTLTSSTSFEAILTGLQSGTAYEWRVSVDGTATEPKSFTTETIVELPNMSFDTWTQEGKNWYANNVANNYDDPSAWWATGNEGITSSLAGGYDATTQPVSGTDAYKGKAAKMRSITGVILVGAAAGNLFIGTYKTNMGNPAASVSFGRPYNGARPTKLTGYYKYKPMPITNDGTVPGNLQSDECHIYIRLWDASDKEIAYGEFYSAEQSDTYQPFEIDIQYTDQKAKPAKITIVATSSRYGGEFSGPKIIGQVGDGSTLWVDEFELLYD